MRRPRFFSEQIPRTLSQIVGPTFPVLGNHANLAHVLLEFSPSQAGFPG